MKYHTHLLTLTGNGTSEWALTKVGTAEERMGVDREIAMLEKKLAEVVHWEERLKVLDGLLSIQEPIDGADDNASVSNAQQVEVENDFHEVEPLTEVEAVSS